jgi:hypothetical protein
MAAGDQFDATMNYLLTAGLLGFCGGSHVSINEINRVGGYQGRVTPICAPKILPATLIIF